MSGLTRALAPFVQQNYSNKKFILSGRRNPITGGVILANVKDIAEAEQLVRDDPFYKNGITDYEFIEFQTTKWGEAFSPYI
ncbi:YciI family protein [Metabacillus sp. RGM 3146]|uniref:YciI family protein n=1 Tax=Metabacillus sp. RGM 3146 TaxID=3401092 RepID=UPI003B9CE78E